MAKRQKPTPLRSKVRGGVDPLDGIELEEAADIAARSELDHREQSFVVSYLRYRNRTRAAREAGYDGAELSTFGRLAERIMARPHVREAIEERLRMRLERIEVTPVRIEQELAKVAFANVANYIRVQTDGSVVYDWTDATEEDLAAIASIKVKRAVLDDDDKGEAPLQVLEIEVKPHSKLDALGKLAQIYKMLGADVNLSMDADLAAELRARRSAAGLPEPQTETPADE